MIEMIEVGDIMVDFYLQCMIIFLLFYLFTILFNKYINSYLQELKKIFTKNDIQEVNDYQKISFTYNLILLFILVFSNFIHIYNHTVDSNLLIINRNYIIYLGIAILFYLIGRLSVNGKTLIYALNDNYQQIIKSITLTGIGIIILPISTYCISPITITFTGLTCLYIIDYFHIFQKKMMNMKKKEFLLQFVWFILINFLNSFLLIYSICHM